MTYAGYPVWQLVYFGTLGSASAAFFVSTAWAWFKSRSSITGLLRSAIGWSMLGYLFLFIAAYMACGIGGRPGGSLLSTDVAARNTDWGTTAALLSKFFSLPGWVCVFVGMRKLLKHAGHA